MTTSQKAQGKLARKRRIRAKISGTAHRPRMTVSRSLTQMHVQLVDDTTGKTIASASTKELQVKPNMEGAKKLGEAVAKKAKDAKIEIVVFDRNAFLYHGRIKALADSAREAGLRF